jgi:hypothetical protein
MLYTYLFGDENFSCIRVYKQENEHLLILLRKDTNKQLKNSHLKHGSKHHALTIAVGCEFLFVEEK